MLFAHGGVAGSIGYHLTDGTIPELMWNSCFHIGGNGGQSQTRHTVDSADMAYHSEFPVPNIYVVCCHQCYLSPLPSTTTNHHHQCDPPLLHHSPLAMLCRHQKAATAAMSFISTLLNHTNERVVSRCWLWWRASLAGTAQLCSSKSTR